MRLRHLYLALCIAGIALPYWALVPWFMEHGLDLTLFCQELFATRIGAFFGLDVFVSAIVLFVFVFAEGRRIAISHCGCRCSPLSWSECRSACRSFSICGSGSWMRKPRRVDLIPFNFTLRSR